MPDNIVVTNPSPKTRFLASGNNISAHRAMVDSPAFQRAADFALLQYQAALVGNSMDGNQAAANAYKLQGAQEFLSTLRMLSEVPTAPARPATPGALNEKA